MKQIGNEHQGGIVSLLTVIFTSILFTVVVVGMISLIASQQHQASEADLSNRAYFGAESGLEAGLLQVKYDLAHNITLTNSKKCNFNTTTSGAGYNSCVVMSNIFNSNDDFIPADGIYQLPLGSNTVTKIQISWFSTQDYNAQSNNPSLLSTLVPSTLPDASAWLSPPKPPILEVASILYSPSATSFSPTDNTQVKIAKTILYPIACTGCGFTTTTEYDNTPSGINAAPYSTKPVGINCDMAGTGFACNAEIDITNVNAPIYGRILVLHALYGSTHFKINILNNSHFVPISIPTTYEVINVTSQVANTTRRVYSMVQTQQGTTNLDYAIWSDTNICHDFGLRDSENGNPPNPLLPGGGNPAIIGACSF